MFFGDISTDFSGHFVEKNSNQPLSPKGMRTFCSYGFKCASHLVICCGIIKHEEDISCSVCHNYCYELATSRCFHNLNKEKRLMVDDKLLGSWNGCFTLFNFCCSFLFLCFVCPCIRTCNFWCSVDSCLEAGLVFPQRFEESC